MNRASTLLVLLVLTGCTSPKPRPTRLVAHTDPGSGADPWKPAWTDPDDDRPVFLGNGKLGAWFTRFGTGTGSLRLSDQWQRDGVAELQEFGNPLTVALTGIGPYSQPHRNFRQTMDLRDGHLHSEWDDGQGHRFETVTVIHPSRPILAYRLLVTGAKGVGFSIAAVQSDDKLVTASYNPLDFSFPLAHGGPTVHVRQRLSGIDNLDPMFLIQGTRLNGVVDEDGTLTFELLIGVGDSVSGLSFDNVSKAASVANSPIGGVEFDIDGPVGDRQAVRSMLFHIRTGVNPDGPTGPFGLSNKEYGGRVFWDSDTWMFPALALLDPNRARSIPAFRIKTATSAMVAYRKWAGATQHQNNGFVGCKFPWEAGPDGDEEVVGDSKNQDHVTGSVAFGLRTAAALGLVDNNAAQRVVKGCARYYLQRSEKNADGSWGVLRTMSPDEYARNVDNDLYTNLVAEWTLSQTDHRWRGKFKRPRDKEGYLTYDRDPRLGYRQAAALLAVWPLQDPDCESRAESMLDHFAEATTPNGPAMSLSVEALIRARFGDTELAYQEWRRSWMNYTRRPLLTFTEAPQGPDGYFLTGAAGCLDAFLFGFVGLRIDDHDPGEMPWKRPLRNGCWLSCRPHLPTAWNSVSIRGLTVLGVKYDLEVKAGAVKVSRR